MTQVILDPTGEKGAAQRDPLPTPASLKDLTVGLLDISKVKGDVFLDRIDALLSERGLKIIRFKRYDCMGIHQLRTDRSLWSITI